jgi:hypothetical protein
MYQTIGEKINVVGIYTPGRFSPKKFQWQQRTFVIDQVCAVHDFKDGTVRKRRFSVQTKGNGNVYLLEFNRDLETWTLEQLWVEE